MIINKIGVLLKDRGYSIAELARATGLTYKNAWALCNESVGRVEFRTMAKLCEFLGCQPGDLFAYDPRYIPGLENLPWTAQATEKAMTAAGHQRGQGDQGAEKNISNLSE